MKFAIAVVSGLVVLGGTAAAAGTTRVIKTSSAHSYKTATCPSGQGKCLVVPGRETSIFSLASKPSTGTRTLHAVIYAGICDKKTVVERIVRVEERRHSRSVDLLVVLEKRAPANPSDPPVMCPALARAFGFEIRLSAKLGTRTVRDASTIPPRRAPTVGPA